MFKYLSGCQDPWHVNPKVPLAACTNVTYLQGLEVFKKFCEIFHCIIVTFLNIVLREIPLTPLARFLQPRARQARLGLSVLGPAFHWRDDTLQARYLHIYLISTKYLLVIYNIYNIYNDALQDD